jgi:hypothetical protein
LPAALKPGFEKFRRGLTQRARSDLDQLALRLGSLKGPGAGGNYLAFFTNAIARAVPDSRPEESMALAFYALCVWCDPTARHSVLGTGAQPGTFGTPSMSSGGSTQDLMQATQQMQETQMSFNLQYLMLQANVQDDSPQYFVLNQIMKRKYQTVRGVLANLK